ncbi:MFS transporter, partial [bacterium]|nr:MFS transporter [bacterium]
MFKNFLYIEKNKFIINKEKSIMAGEKKFIKARSMWIYAFGIFGMQLFVGMMADKHGGIRVILVSGCFLCLGSLIFPLSGQIWTLYLSRALVGFGASGMYLCVIKETDSFFGGKSFAPMLGFFCMIGYGGGLCGTRPFRMMVDWMGWRTSLL